jgi:excisionase family DNA binding protein
MRAREGFDLLQHLFRERPVPLAVSPKDAAHLLGVSVVTIYSAIAKGELRARKLGLRTLVETSSIREMLESLPQPKLTTNLKQRERKSA